MDFKVLRALVAAYIDDNCATNDYSGDLLRLRDTLQELADEVNDTYMDRPQLYTHTCEGFGDMSSCGVRFSILTTPREDRRPETCVECYEKDTGHTSVLREPRYDYKRGV